DPCPIRLELSAQADKQSPDLVRAQNWSSPRRHLTATIAVDGSISSEQLDQPAQVPIGDSREEAIGQLLAFPPGRVKARLAGLDMTPRTRSKLTAVRHTLVDDPRDLLEVIAEDIVEHEDRAFDGTQPLQEKQE